jgi:predicted AlkP superfamily phosphohydrolase/phosphomutase
VRVLLIGIDGACLPVLKPLFDAGTVPTIESLFGGSVPLQSSIPPWTPSAWPSLYTGTNPGKHGVFGFLDYDGYDWDVVNATHVREHALWELLDHHGLSSVVVNVPSTHPPRPFDGALVPGYLAPADPACHPRGTLSDLREHLGEYRVYPTHTGQEDTSRSEQLAEYRALTRLRCDAFRYLVDRHEPDFGFIQFQQPDTVIHEHPGDRDALSAVYTAVDEAVEAIIEANEPELIVLASDHGVGPYDGHEFRVNEFLREAGFVEPARGSRGMPSWQALQDGPLHERGDKESGSGLLAGAVAFAARAGFTSQRLGAALARIGADEFVLRHVPDSVVRAGTEHVDFAASTAYMRHRCELGVRLNVAGREPDGVVPPEEYRSVRAEIIRRLLTARTPDGKVVFDDVAPREDYFHGPETDAAVDIVTVPAEFDQFLSASLRGDIFGNPTEPWNHKRDGVLAVAGTGTRKADELDHPDIHDVAPTVLAAFGVPVSERMDGRVLPVVEPTERATYPEHEAAPASTTDDPDLETRLESLGYLE